MINRLSDMKNQKEKLEDQLSRVKNNLESIKQEREKYQEEIEKIEEIWDEQAQESAEEDIMEFAEHLKDLPPEDIDVETPASEEELQHLLREYLGYEENGQELTEYHVQEISEKQQGLNQLINSMPQGSGMFGLMPDVDPVIPTDAEYQQMEQMNRIQRKREHNNAKMQFYRAESKENFLQEEKDRLESEIKSLDYSEIFDALKVNIATISLSVVIPIGVYLNQATSIVSLPEPSTVIVTSGFWGLGLGVVFFSIFRRAKNF